MKLFHKIYGEKGPHIFILHGLFGMLDNWHNIARSLSRQYRVVCIDARNHGQSPHDDSMTYNEMAGDLIDLAKALSIQKFTLMGHSMGGKTAMICADVYPAYLEKLIVVDIAPKGYPPGHGKYFEAFESINWAEMADRKEIDLNLSHYESNVGVRLFLAKNIERKAEGGFEVKSNIQAIQKAYAEISGSLTFQHVFNKPALFIRGEKSSYVLDSDKATILTTFPQAVFKQIPNAGHWVHAENPSDFLETIEQFIGFTPE